MAAYAAEGLSHFVRSFNYRVNLLGSVELLNLSIKHGVNCFVFASSIAVYGSQLDLVKQGINVQDAMTESTKPDPEDPYGISKYAMELDLRAAHERFGTFVVF